MAKAGMRRPDSGEAHDTESNRRQAESKNDAQPAPEVRGKAKHGNEKAEKQR